MPRGALTDEHKAEIRRLVEADDDVSYSEIAARFGVTKAVICGAVARMGLNRSARSPIKRMTVAERQRRRREQEARRSLDEPPPLAEEPAGPDPEEVRAQQLEAPVGGHRAQTHRLGSQNSQRRTLTKAELGPMPRRCQWIEGEPDAHEGCKCGRRVPCHSAVALWYLKPRAASAR